MAKQNTGQVGDLTPVTGGIPLPAGLVAAVSCDDEAPNDDLGLQAY